MATNASAISSTHNPPAASVTGGAFYAKNASALDGTHSATNASAINSTHNTATASTIGSAHNATYPSALDGTHTKPIYSKSRLLFSNEPFKTTSSPTNSFIGSEESEDHGSTHNVTNASTIGGAHNATYTSAVDGTHTKPIYSKSRSSFWNKLFKNYSVFHKQL